MNVGSSTAGVKAKSESSGKRKKSKAGQQPDLVDLMEELVGNDSEQKNWKGIVIAVLVILVVLSLILTAIIIVMPKTEKVTIGEPFTFNDMFNNDYQPRKFISEWIGDENIFVYRSREGEVMEYDLDNNVTKVIMDNSTFRRLNTDKYSVSHDRRYILLAHSIERVYRHSYTAMYIIYDRLADLPGGREKPFPSKRFFSKRQQQPLQYAGWAPKGNALTFVYEHDLYYQANPETTPNRITNNGEYMKIFNGIPDWIYEEEILHSNIAHWWSPDATYILYAMFDDRRVPAYEFPYYGNFDNTYGDMEKIAYPKAGDRSPDISPEFKLYLFETGNTGLSRKQLRPPAEFADQEHYFTSVTWKDNNHVMISWLNRPQNRTIYTLCDVIDARCHVSQDVTTNKNWGWVEPNKPVFMAEDPGHYLMVQSQNELEHGYWRHIASITMPVGQKGKRTFITQGTWDVTDILTYDENEKMVYFLSTNKDPRKRHLFRVGILEAGDSRLKTPQCLTCDLQEDCQYVQASFSGTKKYYILHCEGPGVPQYILKSTTDNRHIVLEDNAELKARLSVKAMPTREFLEVEVPKTRNKDDKDNVETLYAQVYLPPVLKKDHITQYPLLINTYGGPGTQKVTEQFSIGWHTYLVSSEHVIYASIDGRGSSARGEDFLHAIYKGLGGLEVQDQIEGTKFLQDHLQYVDKERTALWGWSYGGFVTIHAVGDAMADVFNCGIAVAPVTEWRFYDTVYTERYMGLERENYKAYDAANVTSIAPNFKDKHFMIVHGTADDNVHFQHTAQLMKALTENDVDYRMQIYVDKNHALSGPKTSRHLYRTMTKFLKDDCWEGGKPRVKSETVAEE